MVSGFSPTLVENPLEKAGKDPLRRCASAENGGMLTFWASIKRTIKT
jgi:hypothetical protein